MSNSSGYAARVTQDNLTNNNIIIDTVPPLLYLYGINNTISGLGSPYVDAGAISYDLSYGIQDVTGVVPLILVLLELIISHMMHQTLQVILQI